MDYIEIAGALVGLIYLYLEYKASIYLWGASIVMPLFYIYIFYVAGLYADMGINVYYLLAGVYGWIMWLKKRDEADERAISGTPKRFILPLVLVALGLFGAMAWVLIRFTDSTVPYADAAITALSIVAMWMLAYKYVEQWIVWIVVDVACCALFFHKGLYPTMFLYGLYSIIAIFGYRKWKLMMVSNN